MQPAIYSTRGRFISGVEDGADKGDRYTTEQRVFMTLPVVRGSAEGLFGDPMVCVVSSAASARPSRRDVAFGLTLLGDGALLRELLLLDRRRHALLASAFHRGSIARRRRIVAWRMILLEIRQVVLSERCIRLESNL